jgi:hypothetical protein
MSAICSHLESIELTELPDVIAGCEACLAIEGTWVHPIARSAEPGEDWSWCSKDTLHLYNQIVGKIRLATTAPRNHWWNVPL